MNKGFITIGSLILYLGLACFSCMLTAESLIMSLDGLNPFVVWGLTIAFFVIASMGSAWFVQSLITKGYLPNRNLKFWGGLTLVIIFWLLFSLPTNTHTNYFQSHIKDTVTEDITTTRKYLTQLSQKGRSNSNALTEKGEKLSDSIETLRYQANIEFYGKGESGRKGDGEVFRHIITTISKLTNSNIPFLTNFGGTNNELWGYYDNQISNAKKIALQPFIISEETISKADKINNNLQALNDSIKKSIATNSLTFPEIKQIDAELTSGYSLILSNIDFLDFTPEEEKLVYSKQEKNDVETNTKRATSVFKTFYIDFLGGKLPVSIWQYLLIAILIDVAAFIFFDIFYNNI